MFSNNNLLKEQKALVKILIADDDLDDQALLKDAFQELGITNDLLQFENGLALTDFLEAKSANAPDSKLLGKENYIVLLDLNMPKKGGHEALAEIKRNPNLCNIPVIILSTSQNKDDIDKSYKLGANSFLTKPSGFEKLMEMVNIFNSFWLKTAKIA